LLRKRGTKWYAILPQSRKQIRLMVRNTTQDTLALAGVRGDLEWDELEKAL
jgi:hypothetical protein